MFRFLFLCFTLALLGCGSSGSGDLPATPTPTPVEASPMPPMDIDDYVDLRNPRCTDFETFTGGTLWKPESESTGKPVLLIRTEFKRAFDSCKAMLKNGSYEALRFTGFGNGNRQHWRASSGCKKYAGKNLAGRVICSEPSQECYFKFKAPACQRQD